MLGWSASPSVSFVAPAPKAKAGRVARAVASVAVPRIDLVRERSRSPAREALPGLRRGAPGRLERRSAALLAVMSSEDRAAALDALDRDILAESTQRTNDARLRTISSALKLWGIPMWPPTAASWKALAAMLRAGQYSSAAVYLSAYRVACERRGFALDDLAVRSIRDYTRSCLRGVG